MSDDHEERIREDWYYTYKAWDAADDKCSLERQNEITRLGAEGARLEREIERSERARELQEWIDRFLLNKKYALREIDGLDGSAVPVSDKTEWHQELDRINPRNPVAKLQVESLLAKVSTFKSAWIEAEKIRVAIESQVRSRYFDPIQLEQKHSAEQARNDCVRSSLQLVESSLNVLVSVCGVVQRIVR